MPVSKRPRITKQNFTRRKTKRGAKHVVYVAGTKLAVRYQVIPHFYHRNDAVFKRKRTSC